MSAAALALAVAQHRTRPRCDGNHRAPQCGDPGCWLGPPGDPGEKHDYPACATFRGGHCTCDEAEHYWKRMYFRAVGLKVGDGGRWVWQPGPEAEAVSAERERCARIADDEARIREEAGQKNVEGSAARDRCFAGARAAANVAKGIRSGEVVAGSTQPVLPHPIGTIFSDGYWNLNVVLRDATEVEPRWRIRGQAEVYTADQVRELLRAYDVPGTSASGAFFDPALIAKAVMTLEEEATVRRGCCPKCMERTLGKPTEGGGVAFRKCSCCQSIYALGVKEVPHG
jgi:hypothetical protein